MAERIREALENSEVISQKPLEEWVVVELSQRAEGENPEVVAASIRHLLRNSVVYIPASVTVLDDETTINYLIDGYCFIRRDSFPDAKFYRLEGSKYVQTIVTKPTSVRGARKIACVSSAEINRLRQMVVIQENQGIEVNDVVTVISGPYKNISATVIEDLVEMDSVQVFIHLRSKESLVTLPRSCLRLQTKAPTPPWMEKGKQFCTWFKSVIPLLLWAGNAEDLRDVLDQYLMLQTWLQKVSQVAQQLRVLSAPDITLSEMDTNIESFFRLSSWVRKMSDLSKWLDVDAPLPTESLLAASRSWELLQKWTLSLASANSVGDTEVPSLEPLVEPIEKWVYLQKNTGKAAQLAGELKRLSSRNIVIDGNNMVCRCSMAPGLSDLHDTQGRPTGGIVGTINSLSSLRKKYPDASIYFVWDGSSQRRRAVFPAYKAGRGEPKATFESSWLREALPYFGVIQVTHPDEEADDLIASLVAQDLSGQQNIIVSTDRDLLQLVTQTTHVYVPAWGSAKERVYTPDDVRSEYGVDPEGMPQLRALSGDSSDNIPGVPGFGLKTAQKVLAPYKTVDRLLKSNMAELTQKQYANLRSCADQIRKNAAMMFLLRDLPYQLTPANPDQTAVNTRLLDVDAKVERAMRVLFPDS